MDANHNISDQMGGILAIILKLTEAMYIHKYPLIYIVILHVLDIFFKVLSFEFIAIYLKFVFKIINYIYICTNKT